MDLNSDNWKVITAICLHFFSVACIVLSRTYIDMLFLATYPKSWLPYFFLGQTAVILIVTFVITPLISRGSHLINFSILIVMALTIFLIKTVSDLNIQGLPFAASLWISAISVIIGVISWNTAGDAFDIRRFKGIVKWINSAGSLGGLFIGLLIPIFISLFEVDILLYILGLLMFLSGLFVLRLKPVPVFSKKTQGGASPLKYPLFRMLFLSVFILMLIDTFADYALKSEVGSIFSREDIGNFMGPFYGIASVLSLVIQLSGTNILLRYFGIAFLLSILPGFCIISGSGLLVYPGLWLAAFFRLGENVFRYSLDNIGCEIASNPLPSQVRRAGKLLLKGAATPLGTGVGALFLWLTVDHFGLRSLGVATIFASAIWIIIIKRIRKEYQNTLKEAIKIKRFNIESEETTETALQATHNLAIDALQEKDPDAIRFGLMILEDIYSERLPDIALQQINSEFPDIRASLAKTAGRLKDKKATNSLKKRLEIEKDPEVIWRLLEALSIIDPEPAVPKATEFLRSSSPTIKAGAILVLLAAGDLDAIIEAGIALREMVHSPEPNMRKGAARAISSFKAGKLEKELRLLIEDSDENVCISAIRAASARKTLGLIGELVAKLGHGRVSRYASHTLTEFGLPSTSNLLDAIMGQNYKKSRIAIRTLASIPAIEVENTICDIAKAGNVVVRTNMAKEAAKRARRYKISNPFKQSALSIVMDEFEITQLIRSAKNDQSISDYIRAEIHARQKLAETRFFYWFAVCTQASVVIDIIPLLLSDGKSQNQSSRRAAAIELLDTLAPNKELKNAINLLDGRAQKYTGNTINNLKKIDDPWLDHIFSTRYSIYKGGEMDITQKVLLLRKTRLFEFLPGEILLTIAEECEDREIVKDEKIVSQGDYSDGLYIVASGTLEARKNGQTLSKLSEGDFFGEIGLLDDSPRIADVIATSRGTILFIEKDIFHSITEDLPEVLRAVIKTVIGYLKKERNSLRIEPTNRDPIDAYIGPNRSTIKNIGSGGVGIQRNTEEISLEIGKKYSCKMTLPLINETISCEIKIIDVSDSTYHCEFIDLSNTERNNIQLFMLERQKENIIGDKKRI